MRNRIDDKVKATRQECFSLILLYLLLITTFHLVVMKYSYTITRMCAPIFWHEWWLCNHIWKREFNYDNQPKYWLACIFSVCIIACTSTWLQHVSKLYPVCEKLSTIFFEFYFLTYLLIPTGNYYYYYYLKKAKENKEYWMTLQLKV